MKIENLLNRDCPETFEGTVTGLRLNENRTYYNMANLSFFKREREREREGEREREIIIRSVSHASFDFLKTERMGESDTCVNV